MSQAKLTLLVPLVSLLAACCAVILYHWSRLGHHLAPGAPAWTALASWHRDDPAQYTPDGQRHLARMHRYQLLAVVLGVAVVLVNVYVP